MLYRAAKQRFDEEEEFKTRSREAVTQLQGGKPEYLQARREGAREQGGEGAVGGGAGGGAGGVIAWLEAWCRLCTARRGKRTHACCSRHAGTGSHMSASPLQPAAPLHASRLPQAWQRICNASRQEFQKIYDRLGVTLEGEAGAVAGDACCCASKRRRCHRRRPIHLCRCIPPPCRLCLFHPAERGESFYNPMLKPGKAREGEGGCGVGPSASGSLDGAAQPCSALPICAVRRTRVCTLRPISTKHMTRIFPPYTLPLPLQAFAIRTSVLLTPHPPPLAPCQ